MDTLQFLTNHHTKEANNVDFLLKKYIVPMHSEYSYYINWVTLARLLPYLLLLHLAFFHFSILFVFFLFTSLLFSKSSLQHSLSLKAIFLLVSRSFQAKSQGVCVVFLPPINDQSTYHLSDGSSHNILYCSISSSTVGEITEHAFQCFFHPTNSILWNPQLIQVISISLR